MANVTPARRSYRRIDAAAVHETIVKLEARIASQFPESGLRKVAQDLIDVSRGTPQRIHRIRRRSIVRRLLAWLLSALIIAILVTIPLMLRPGRVETLAEAVNVLEAALSAAFFIGASLVFLLTWETRMRHQRTMDAVHELRALAHVVDMHQLTKDPPMLLGVDVTTPSSASPPPRTYTPFELQRYLDYCSEMLALISKIAVLYVQDSTDGATIAIVDEIEDLTNGLSRKCWQKIMVIQRGVPAATIAPPSLEPARVPPQTVATK
ncbi:MAG: hypothetical protein QOF78_1700 [Phycisphaerales bacterium]|nr:hypothetical protein [Phycisphaerales bacterium]